MNDSAASSSPGAWGVALLPIMLGAARVHWANGWVHTSPGGGWEYPVFLSIASFALWLMGDGAASLRSGERFTWSR